MIKNQPKISPYALLNVYVRPSVDKIYKAKITLPPTHVVNRGSW
jgi:hypothetical protein